MRTPIRASFPRLSTPISGFTKVSPCQHISGCAASAFARISLNCSMVILVSTRSITPISSATSFRMAYTWKLEKLSAPGRENCSPFTLQVSYTDSGNISQSSGYTSRYFSREIHCPFFTRSVTDEYHLQANRSIGSLVSVSISVSCVARSPTVMGSRSA